MPAVSIVLLIVSALSFLIGGAAIYSSRKPFDSNKINMDVVHKQKKEEESVEEFLERMRARYKSTGKRQLIYGLIFLGAAIFFIVQ